MDDLHEVQDALMLGYRQELEAMLDPAMIEKLDEIFLLPLAVHGDDEITDDFISAFCVALYRSGKLPPGNTQKLRDIICSARALVRADL